MRGTYSSAPTRQPAGVGTMGGLLHFQFDWTPCGWCPVHHLPKRNRHALLEWCTNSRVQPDLVPWAASDLSSWCLPCGPPQPGPDHRLHLFNRLRALAPTTCAAYPTWATHRHFTKTARRAPCRFYVLKSLTATPGAEFPRLTSLPAAILAGNRTRRMGLSQDGKHALRSRTARGREPSPCPVSSPHTAGAPWHVHAGSRCAS